MGMAPRRLPRQQQKATGLSSLCSVANIHMVRPRAVSPGEVGVLPGRLPCWWGHHCPRGSVHKQVGRRGRPSAGVKKCRHTQTCRRRSRLLLQHQPSPANGDDDRRFGSTLSPHSWKSASQSFLDRSTTSHLTGNFQFVRSSNGLNAYCPRISFTNPGSLCHMYTICEGPVQRRGTLSPGPCPLGQFGVPAGFDQGGPGRSGQPPAHNLSDFRDSCLGPALKPCLRHRHALQRSRPPEGGSQGALAPPYCA